MREGLDYVVWFTLAWSGVVIVMAAAAIAVFLFVRRQSRTGMPTKPKAQGLMPKD